MLPLLQCLGIPQPSALGGSQGHALGCLVHRHQAPLASHRLCATPDHASASPPEEPKVLRPRRPALSMPEPSPEARQDTASDARQTKAQALYKQRALAAKRDRRRPSVIRAAPPSFQHTMQGEEPQGYDQPVLQSQPAPRRRRAAREAAAAAFQPVPTPPEELKSKQLLQQPEHVPGMGSFARKVARSNLGRENWRDAIPLHPASVAASSSGVDDQRMEAIKKWHEWKAAVAKDQERFDRPEDQSASEVDDDETTWADRSELLLDQRPEDTEDYSRL